METVDPSLAPGSEVLTRIYDGKKLKVYWPTPFAPGEKRALRLTYSIQQPVTGMFFSYPDQTNPKRPVYAITDHETERARYWLPCIDYPSVRTTLRFDLIAPKQMTALGTELRLSPFKLYSERKVG